LEQLATLRDQLYAAAAHSLNTPVAVIRTNAQLLAARPEPAVARSAQAIDRQTRRLGDLIQNLLVLARVRSGRLMLRPHEVDLANVVERATGQLEREQSGHRIVSSIEAHPRGFVDAERMGLLVRNLLEEANSRARPGSDVALRLTEDGESAEIRTEYA